ncbi:MAG: MarR family transcriptional regulator [Pseudomonadota bacterium]
MSTGAVETDPENRELTQFLSYRIVRVHQTLNAQAVAVLDAVAGITLTQWRLIAMIGTGTATTARDVTRRTMIDPAMISRTTKALEEAGLLSTSRPDSDRRVVEMELTPRGQEIFERTLPFMRTRQQALMDALDEDEQAIIFGILDKLERAADRRDFGQ